MNKSFADAEPYDCPSCKKKQTKHEVRCTPIQRSWHCPGCHYRLRVDRLKRRGCCAGCG